jgi:hypothetical protein
MTGGLELLRDNVPLRRLLAWYREQKQTRPDAPWHDRLMQAAGVSADQISKLHGLLLAHGWIETRVDPLSFAEPGRLRECYRVTREGSSILRFLEDSRALDLDLEEYESELAGAPA